MLLLSLCAILLFGLLIAFLCKKLNLPVLIGYLAVGIILGPYVLNMINVKILNISAEFRQIALIIILLRAGLSLDLSDLKRMGKLAVLMSFIPAVFELFAVGLLGPLLFDISYLDAFILGSVLGAVSPAVVVPRMVKMIDENRGVAHEVPELIIAGSSIDDIVVIVIFTALTTVAAGGTIGIMTYFNVPISIILGIASGIGIGLFMVWFFKRVHIRDTLKVIIICAVCFGLVAVEELLEGIVGFSGLLATITIGVVISSKYKVLSQRLSQKYSKLWILSEIILFVLVGASVNIKYFVDNLGFAMLLIVCGLAIRSVGVLLCLIKSKLDPRERLFTVIAYTPKATVQAAIGGIPLAMGLASGNIILSVAVISILFTAPFGALVMDLTVNKLVPIPKPKETIKLSKGTEAIEEEQVPRQVN